MAHVAIDSGTTTTRVRLWHEGEVRWTATRPVGARDTTATGSTARLREALGELIAQLRRETRLPLEAAVCSGMITSNVGLLEVPHLLAPAAPGMIAANLVRHDFPDIADLPFVFVPGVKTLPATLSLGTLAEADVLRGEECECLGLGELAEIRGPATFLHFGSHHKAIDVAADGTITASRTGITGELYAAITEHTILKSSTVHIEAELIDEFARAGLEAARIHSLARALFLVRVGEQLWQRTPEQMTSFLLGALAGADLPLVGPVQADRRVILYGKGPFPQLLAPVLRDAGHDVVRIAENSADIAAAVGATRLYLQGRDRVLGM